MANPNYAPMYKNYLTNTAGYALPSNVRTYSVFDPSSNSWRRMTNDGRSPLPMTPAQEQAAVAGALMQAQQTQGKVWNPLPAPAQTPAQTPLGGPRMASNRQLGGGMGVPASQPSASPRGASMSPADVVAFGAAMQNPGANLQAQPRVFMPLESRYENFQTEIPRSNLYGPLQNPRVVRNMSPDYQEASAAPVAVAQPAPAASTVPAQTARAIGYPTTDIFGNDQFWRQANHYNERDARLNELGRHIRQVGDAALFHSPLAFTVQVPAGLAGYAFGPTTEPLARVTLGSSRATSASKVLDPKAQRVLNSLRFTFSH